MERGLGVIVKPPQYSASILKKVSWPRVTDFFALLGVSLYCQRYELEDWIAPSAGPFTSWVFVEGTTKTQTYLCVEL